MEKTPQQKAIDTLIHDHNSASGRINSYRWLIENALKTNELDELPYYLEKIRECVKESQNCIDAYYIKFKNNFE